MINGKQNNVPYHPLPWDIPEETGDVIWNEGDAYVTRNEVDEIVNNTVDDMIDDAVADAMGDISIRDNGDGTYTLMIGEREAGTIVIPADKYLTDVYFNDEGNIVFVVKSASGDESDIVLDAGALLENGDDGVFDLGDINDPSDDTFVRDGWS